MSVLEATISYTRIYTRDIKDEALWHSMSLPFGVRRSAGTAILGSIFVLGVVYLYLVGSVVAMGFSKEHIHQELDEVYAASQGAERALLQEGRIFTEDFFANAGYTKPQTFQALTRSRNVAETAHNQHFY